MTILSKNTRRGSNQIKSYTVEDAFGNVLTIAKEDFTDWERNNDRDVAMIAGTFVPSNQDEADQVSLAQSRAEMGETAYETLQRQSENPTDDGINAPIEGVDYDIVYDPVTNTSQRVYRGQDVNKATAAANAESSTGLLDDLGMAVSSVKDAVGLGETQKKVANGVTYTLPVNMPTQQSVYEDLAKEYLKTYGADLDLNKQAELMQKAGLIVEDPATMQKVDNSMGSADMGKSLRNAQLSYFDPAAAARRDTGGSGGKGDGSALSDKYSTLESSDRNFGESLSLLMNNMVTDLISLPGAVATDIGKLINGVSNQITGTDLITSTEAPAEAQTFGEAFNAARAAQGDGGVFTYDGKQYTTDLAPAGMDSVISTGGPGTFAPGSLPASTGTSALDGYTQLADTMRDSGSLDLSGRTGSEAFSTGMADDGSAAVATGDLSAAEILNNQSNTIQPLKISTDVGAPLSTDIDNIDSAIIAAAQDDAKKNGFDLDTEQGMEEVDRILGERSDYDKLLAVAMDPMNSGYTDAMETLVTDYGVDANVIAIEADKALTEKENSDAALANANLDPALRFANENVSDYFF